MFQTNLFIRMSLAVSLLWAPNTSIERWLYGTFIKLTQSFEQESSTLLVVLDKSQPQENTLITWERNQQNLIWNEAKHSSLNKYLLSHQAKLLVYLDIYHSPIELKKDPLKNQILFSSKYDSQQRWKLPGYHLRKFYDFGFSHLIADDDEQVRSIPLYSHGQGSLALMAYQGLLTKIFPYAIENSYGINYKSPRSLHIIYESDLGDEYHDELLKNKIILITHPGSLTPTESTPLGKMSLAMVQAQAIDSLVTERMIHFFPKKGNRLLALLTLIASSLLIMFLPSLHSWLLFLCFCLAILILGFICLVTFHLWIDISLILICLFCTHALLIGYRLTIEEERRKKLILENENRKKLSDFKINFISLFSHDLKTPIAKSHALIEKLRNTEKKSPREEQLLTLIETNQTELSRHISNILRVTKMEAQELKPQIQPMDINRVIQSVVSKASSLFSEKHIRIKFRPTPLFPIEADKELIAEVIYNLIENACKYTPKESTVLIQTQDREDEVCLSLKDQGPGFPNIENMKNSLKEPFFSSQTGTGLGLYLANYFIDQHQGRIEFQNLAQGSLIKVFLPVSPLL